MAAPFAKQRHTLACYRSDRSAGGAERARHGPRGGFVMLDQPASAPKLNPLYPPHPVPEGAKPTKVPMRYLPQLSLAERDRRWDELRKRMVLGRFDALLFLGNDIYWDMGIANIRYVFQVASKISLYAAFFVDQAPVVWNSVAHMNRPFNYLHSTQEWVSDIRAFRGLGEICAELRSRGFARSRIGLVAYSSTIQTTPTFIHGEIEALK